MFIAALPPAHPPAPTVAGVHVTWPLSKPVTTLAPGATLTVRLSSSRRSAKVSLVRVNAQGKGLGLVAQRTLRRGSFTVKVPANAAPGSRYALRLAVAGAKRWSWVTTAPASVPLTPQPAAPVATAAPDPAPVETPAPVDPPMDTVIDAPVMPLPFCATLPELPASAFRAEVRLGSTTIHAGETLSYTIANVGEGSLLTTEEQSLHLETEHAPGPANWTGSALAPGDSVARTFEVPAGTAPGRYRLTQTIAVTQCDYVYPLTVDSPVVEVLP